MAEATQIPAGKCPTCGKQGHTDHRPFCSQRCADVDLGRWMTESYRIPVNAADEDDMPDPEDIEATR